MATPTNLYQYYTGQGQALPSVAQNAQTYQKYGLGSASGYSGTASQNTALLQKLMGSGGSGGYSTPPASTAPTGGGYSSGAPSGDPLLTQDIGNLNSNQSDLQALAAKQASDLNAFTKEQQGTIAGAFTTAMGQDPNYQKSMDTMNKIQDALTGTQNAQAAVVPQTVQAARGSMANNDQVTAQESTSNIPYAEQVAQLSANLVPAENTFNTENQKIQNIAGNIVSGAQLAEQGFTAGQQTQLSALQSKVDQGLALTNDEYNSYAQLTSAQTSAAAQIKAANIGAGASIANTASTNAINRQIAALNNPGVTLDSNGIGQLDLNTLFSKLGIPNPSSGGSSSSSSNPATVSAINNLAKKYGF